MPQRPRPFASDFVYELAGPGSPSVHPTDGTVAYVVSGASRETQANESHLELAPFSGGGPRPLTVGPRDGSPRWSPDGSRLAFLRREEAGEPAQLWLLPADGGEATRLTGLAGGVAELTWAPGGNTLYCTSDVDPDAGASSAAPRTREVRHLYYRGDTIGWRGEIRRHVFRVDVESGRTRQLTRGDFHHRGLALSPDGGSLAFASDRARRRYERAPWGAELCVMPAAGGRVRRLVRDLVISGGLAWSPDGARIAFVGGPEENIWQRYVHVVEVRDGNARRLTDDRIEPQAGFFPIAPAPPLVWRGRSVIFTADARGSSGVYAVTPSGRVRALRARPELIGGFDATPDGRRVAFVASSSQRPPEVRTLDTRSGRSYAVTATAAPYLEGRAVGRTERLRVCRAGQSIDCWLLHPPGFDRGRRYPLVLEIHGSPNGFFGTGFNPLHQLLAGAGFLVLSVNPRGSTTYGSDFSAAVFEDWGGEDYLDLMAAVDTVCRRPYVDERRLGLHGYSYGGYMSAWIAGHSDRFRAAVIGAPVTNLVSMYGQTDIAASFGERQWGGLPHDNLEHYLERSPLTYADRVTTPLLLLHGEADIRVPISQSEELFTALKRRGKTVELVRFPDCSHLFMRVGHPALRQEYYDRAVGWLQRWLRR